MVSATGRLNLKLYIFIINHDQYFAFVNIIGILRLCNTFTFLSNLCCYSQ